MDPVLREMTRNKSEYVRLLGRLVRKFQAGRIPAEDFQQLTTKSDFAFANGRAKEATVDQLRTYLEAIEEVPA